MKVRDLYNNILEKKTIGSFEQYDLNDINDGFGNQKTPIIIIAVQSRKIPLIKYLLSNGVDVNKTDKFNNTALHWLGRASHYEKGYNNNIQIAKLLLENGANPNLSDNVGNTPINYVVHYSKKFGIDLIRTFLEYGADPNNKNDYGISTKEVTYDEEILKLYEEHGF